MKFDIETAVHDLKLAAVAVRHERKVPEIRVCSAEVDAVAATCSHRTRCAPEVGEIVDSEPSCGAAVERDDELLDRAPVVGELGTGKARSRARSDREDTA